MIEEEQYEKTVREPLVVQPREPRPNKAPYFTEFVRQEIEEKTGITAEELRQQRYVIHSTLDTELQNIAEQELKKDLREVELLWQKNKYARFLEEGEKFQDQPLQKGQVRLAKISQVFSDSVIVELEGYRAHVELPDPLPYYEPKNVIKVGGYLDIEVQDVDHEKNTFAATAYDQGRIQGAILVLDAHTGHILAMVGGEEFYDQANNGMWNRATQARRQPGSSFKPFVYAAALELGYTPATIFEDKEIIFPDGYAPKNYENKFFGPTTLQEALEKSRNVVTILLFQSLGARRALEIMQRFDFCQPRRSWQLPTDPTVALGNIGTTLLELTAAYIPFVNNGVGIEPLGVTRITDNNGKAVAELRPRELVVISPQTAYIETRMLLGAVERGTGAEPIGSYFEGKKVPEIGGKTGTTNDCVDAWFVGFTPDLVIGVYVGFDQVRTLGPVMTGSRVAAPIWRDFLDRALKTRSDWHARIEEPDGIVYADVCSKSGLLATRGCYHASDAHVYRKMAFKAGSEPKETCTLH
jgi:penicillin-binding protein 1A